MVQIPSKIRQMGKYFEDITLGGLVLATVCVAKYIITFPSCCASFFVPLRQLSHAPKILIFGKIF